MKQYGIIRLKPRAGSKTKVVRYQATVPLADGGQQVKSFGSHEYLKPKESAFQWQQRRGISEWGAERWSLITKGALQAVKGRGVACYKGYTTYKGKKHPQWVVSWRNLDGSKQSKIFSAKKYGSLQEAKRAACLFQSFKRAERSRNLLHLPPEISAGLGYGD
ncbi:AP2 domain-containing protein [Vibrio vulnificus]|uniref:AP2 domain-containing protein n=1 Tax=Vibrio vulnificus TaxID=672 RepID=A0AAW4H639_VIBVL|nr:AP2 domain-containing protein [Vibrio vulnificus]MBN8120529.1 AP2 domain-containing protein [Vibrio vulnificus]HAS6086784.1 AP2 domain-containing protein [Vibrio vulnificus]HDY7440441.1 AP2 domain-containing protein [Vibrio vulnificus]HDY7898761.1 AP2 domain-containing protein [Vibrio vulnificus]HDY7939031.1 AP2 domain-containing protein [Vibrio vulnificus]